MREHFDGEFLYFFDAIAPIIDADTIDKFVAYKADRWGKGDARLLQLPAERRSSTIV